jgi:hypothetical protein
VSPPRRRGGDYSPRKDDRRERDEYRRERTRSRSPNDRERDGDREMKDARDPETRENGANGDDRKGISSYTHTTEPSLMHIVSAT